MLTADTLTSFMIDEINLRGAIVRFDSALDCILKQHPYPNVVAHTLCQTLCAITLIFSTLKFKGRLILQIKCNQDIELLVCKCNDQLQVSGLAQWDATKNADKLSPVFEDANMAITLINDEYTTPHQSIIELHNEEITTALENYFKQSEQLPTKFWLSSNEQHAIGLLVQLLPKQNQYNDTTNYFLRISQEINAMDPAHIFSEYKPCEWLQRIFCKHNIQILQTKKIEFKCECSKKSMKNAIVTLGKQDALGLLVTHPSVEVRCEFCNQTYDFNKDDITDLFSDQPDQGTMH